MFITDPVLSELWIVALACLVNRTDPWPIHADTALEVEIATRERRAFIARA